MAEAVVRLRPGSDLTSPLQTTKTALRHLARRFLALSEEITELDTELAPLVAQAAPILYGRNAQSDRV